MNSALGKTGKLLRRTKGEAVLAFPLRPALERLSSAPILKAIITALAKLNCDRWAMSRFSGQVGLASQAQAEQSAEAKR